MADSIAFHSTLAESWSARYRHSGFRSRAQVFAAAIQSYASAGQSWLDAGCGTGELSECLQQLGCKVSAIDGSAEMVQRCKVPATVARIESLPFADESLDGVVCSSVLEYLEDPSVALREFLRVLKADSPLLVSVPNADSVLRGISKVSYAITGRPRYLKYSRHAYSGEAFEQLLVRYGFRPEQRVDFGPNLPGRRRIPFVDPLRLYIARKA